LSPEDKARAQLDKLQERLAKSQARLAECREQGDEEKIIEALVSTVSRLTDKISAAQKQMNEAEGA
jgi:electron transport complex protein RnfC